MRAVVTGGAGFIGSHLVDRLVAEGHSVAVVDDLSTGHRDRIPDDVALHVVDIVNAREVTNVVVAYQPDVIYHLAGQIGPRQDPHGEAGVIAIFGGHLARGAAPTIYSDGKQTRDYVYVADIVDAFRAANDYTGDEAVFNIGTGTATAVIALLDVINAVAGTAIEPKFAPAWAGEPRHSALDSAKAALELNWHPVTSVSVEVGIRHTYQQLTQASGLR
jgi:nucleoside-diphosphate-sugar epimerase